MKTRLAVPVFYGFCTQWEICHSQWMVQQDGLLDGEMERSVLTDGIWPETKRGCPITRLCKREALQPEILALHLCGPVMIVTQSSLPPHFLWITLTTGHAISQPMTAYSLGVGACQRLSTHLKALSCRWYLRSETVVTLGQTRSEWGERKREESIGKILFFYFLLLFPWDKTCPAIVTAIMFKN